MPRTKRKFPLVIVSKATKTSGVTTFQETARCREFLELAALAQKGVLTGAQVAALIRDIALKQYRRGSRTS